jgi:hypothetical protein
MVWRKRLLRFGLWVGVVVVLLALWTVNIAWPPAVPPLPAVPSDNANALYARIGREIRKAENDEHVSHQIDAQTQTYGYSGPLLQVKQHEPFRASKRPRPKGMFYRDNAHLLPQIRTALQRPLVDWSHPAVADDYKSWGFKSSACRDLLLLDAIRRRDAGQWRQAADALLDALAFNVQWHRTWPAIYQELAWVGKHLTAVELRECSDRLDGINRSRPAFSALLSQYKADFLYRICSQMHRDWPMRLQRWAVGDYGFTDSFIGEHIYPRGVFVNHAIAWTIPDRQIPVNTACYLDRCISAAKLPFSAHAAFPADPPPDLTNYGHFKIAHWQLEYLQYVTNTYKQDSLLIALALRGYQLKHGQYPEKLQALVDDGWLKQLPRDPFTNDDSFLYRVQGQSYLLYSRGPDGDDDGGTPIRQKRKDVSPETICPDSQGDAVYGINRYSEWIPAYM